MSSAVDHVDETSALLPEPGDSEDGVYPLTVKQSRKCCSGEMVSIFHIIISLTFHLIDVVILINLVFHLLTIRHVKVQKYRI